MPKGIQLHATIVRRFESTTYQAYKVGGINTAKTFDTLRQAKDYAIAEAATDPRGGHYVVCLTTRHHVVYAAEQPAVVLADI